MTQKEIDKFLANTKVYVNGKSKEIQEKLFSLGCRWEDDDNHVLYDGKPFLYISNDLKFCYGEDMKIFTNSEHTEITAEQILSLKLTELSYRPFKNAEECWQEMQKHQPFGWVKRINGGYKQIMAIHIDMFNKHYADFAGQTGIECFKFEYIYKKYKFTDGTPFGIKEE